MENILTIITGIIGIIAAIVIYYREDLKVVQVNVANIVCECYAKDKAKAARLINKANQECPEEYSVAYYAGYLMHKSRVHYKSMKEVAK